MNDSAVIARTFSPNQLQSLSVIGIDENLMPVGDRPTFDATLPETIRAHLEETLGVIVDRHSFTVADPLFLGKHPLGEVFRCETQFLLSLNEPFEWNINKAQGTVLQKPSRENSARCPLYFAGRNRAWSLANYFQDPKNTKRGTKVEHDVLCHRTTRL